MPETTPIPPRSSMQPASSATAVQPVAAPKTLPPALAGILGLLTAAAAVPAAIVVGLQAVSLTVPAWLLAASAIGGGLAPLLAAGAYWANGGNPLDAVRPKRDGG